MIYAVRLFFLGIHIAITSIFGFIYSLKSPCNPSNTYLPAQLLSRLAFKILGIEFELKGAEHLDLSPDGTKIIISNHQSNYDLFFCAFLLPKRAVSVGKKSLLYFPFFGLLYWITGHILIDRKKKNKAMSSMNSIERALVKGRTHIWIMPEGTRSKSAKLLPFKKGPFITSINTKKDIIIVCFQPYLDHLNFNKLKAGKVVAQVLPPISPDSFELKDLEKFQNLCKKKMQNGIDQLQKYLT